MRYNLDLVYLIKNQMKTNNDDIISSVLNNS